MDRELQLPQLFKGCESAEKPTSKWNPICFLPGAQSFSLSPTPPPDSDPRSSFPLKHPGNEPLSHWAQISGKRLPLPSHPKGKSS